MFPTHPSRPNAYTGNPLDRAGVRRSDAAWIAERKADPASLLVPVWRARNLLRQAPDGAPEAVFPTVAEAAALQDGHPWAFLGLHDGQAVFTVDLSAAEEPDTLAPGAAYTDLRMISAGLKADDAAILAHARGLMQWRAKHRFCPNCGTRCEPESAGHVMACPGCAMHHFPRTDPAVIMLVTRGDRALLGHSQRFPKSNMYSTLAGFVEPGESLEEAVAREVLEESGVIVGQVRYHSSQPWPFPASIMLGFYAEGLTEEITIDPDELTDARWFSRAEMRNCREHGFLLPRQDSIARRLVEDWMAA
jgi:NAD+ diphosphatase